MAVPSSIQILLVLPVLALAMSGPPKVKPMHVSLPLDDSIPPVDISEIDAVDGDNGGVDSKPSKGADVATGRIVGGSVADPSRYPYYARVVMQNQFGRIISLCGGTLIHEDYVLSAAHCYVSDLQDDISRILIIANYTQNMSRHGRTGFEQERFVADIFYHPDYFTDRSGAPNYDFMLLKLEEPITTIQPVILNDDRDLPFDNSAIQVFGFGILETGGSSPTRLRDVELDVVSHRDCNDFNSYFGIIDDDIMVCAGETGQSACQGDSGGPGVILGSNPTEDVQVGVVSFGGQICAAANRPGVFARVSAWKEGIKQIVCGDTAVFDGFLCGDSVQPPPPPPPPPAEESCAGGELTIQLITDGYAEETAWQLSRQGESSPFERSENLQDLTIYRETFCLDEGCYRFEISDSFGDGLCCGLFGAGAYSLTLDEETIHIGSAFGSGETIVFGTDDNVCASIDDPITFAPTPAPTPEPTEAPSPRPTRTGSRPSICFPRDAMVQHKERGLVRMDELRIGDSVLTANQQFETIFSFLHLNHDESFEFIQMTTDNDATPLELSPSHLIFTKSSSGLKTVLASELKLGDIVQSSSGDSTVVTKLDVVTKTGAFAPATASGTIVVNGVLVSNYASIQNSATILVSGVSTGISNHWVGQQVGTARLLVCRVSMELCKRETYDKVTHLPTWLSPSVHIAEWIVRDETPALVQLVLLLLAVGVVSSIWMVTSHMLSLMAIGLVAFVVAKLSCIRIRRIKRKRRGDP